MARKSQSGAWTKTTVAATIARAVAKQSAGQEYGVLGSLLKQEFADARVRTQASTRLGDVAAKRYSAFANSVVRALFEAAAQRMPASAARVAVCAVGGFGADRLAPFSDIDLLFLHRFRDENEIKPLLDYVLYALWDAGLVIGHSVHTPQSAVAFAREDMVARTAMLDCRLVAGDAKTKEEFRTRFDRLRVTTKSKFVAAKLREQEARHDVARQSRFLAEPDVKEGKGSLRDIQLMRWLHAYVYDCPIDASGGKVKLFDDADLKSFIAAERFLWSVRVQLHAHSGRADDILAFRAQPEIAKKLGYAERSAMTAAERLMKHYFINATEIGRLMRIFCARLEEDQTKLRPRAPAFIPKLLQTDEAPNKPNLRLRNGRLDFQHRSRARNNPRAFLRLFRAFARKPRYDFSPEALAVIRQDIASFDTGARRDPVNCALFVKSVTIARDPIKLLRVMSETGVLTKMLPFFSSLTGRIEYGLYRRYTLDEQVFQAIGVLRRIEKGEAQDAHPIASEVVAGRKDRAPFYIAVLFHEARASLKDPAPDNIEKLARRIGKRLGLKEKQVADVAWAVAHFAEMGAIAERRSLSDKPPIIEFARAVGDKERLDLTLVLAVCHLRVVSEGAWDRFYRRQLTLLHEGASSWLNAGEKGVDRWLLARAEKARAVLANEQNTRNAAARTQLAKLVSDDIARTLNAEQLRQFMALARSSEGETAAVAVTPSIDEHYFDIMVYTEDRPGLLADLSGALAGAGVTVRTVTVLTTPSGRALDIFTVRPFSASAGLDSAAISGIHSKLLDAARDKRAAKPTLRRRIGDRRALFDVESRIRIDLDASETCTIVEAEGRDRPGLLYKLAAAFADIGVIINRAYISTYGERAIDAFYVQDAPGYKITNKRRLQSIERRLLNVLNEDE